MVILLIWFNAFVKNTECTIWKTNIVCRIQNDGFGFHDFSFSQVQNAFYSFFSNQIQNVHILIIFFSFTISHKIGSVDPHCPSLANSNLPHISTMFQYCSYTLHSKGRHTSCIDKMEYPFDYFFLLFKIKYHVHVHNGAYFSLFFS